MRYHLEIQMMYRISVNTWMNITVNFDFPVRAAIYNKELISAEFSLVFLNGVWKYSFKVFFVWKYIKIIYIFYFLKFIFNINILK
jgi:hypothetical protein